MMHDPTQMVLWLQRCTCMCDKKDTWTTLLAATSSTHCGWTITLELSLRCFPNSYVNDMLMAVTFESFNQSLQNWYSRLITIKYKFGLFCMPMLYVICNLLSDWPIHYQPSLWKYMYSGTCTCTLFLYMYIKHVYVHVCFYIALHFLTFSEIF